MRAPALPLTVLSLSALLVAACTGPPGVPAGTGAASSGPGERPGRLLDLRDWKLTLPVDSRASGQPAEVKQPALSAYASRWFSVDAAGDGVVFRAPAGGATTDGSDFARSELREMTDGGTEQAAWSSEDGTHTMVVREAVTELPPAHPSIVAGQVHGGDSYLVLVRLDGDHLYVKADDEDAGDLDDHYRLGDVFDLTLRAAGGRVRVTYAPVAAGRAPVSVEVGARCSSCYFKAGAYLQSNPSTGDEADAEGAVTLYRLQVTHR